MNHGIACVECTSTKYTCGSMWIRFLARKRRLARAASANFHSLVPGTACWIRAAFRCWLNSYDRQIEVDRGGAPAQFFDADRVGARSAGQVQLVVLVHQSCWDAQLTRFDSLDLLAIPV